MVEPMTFTGLFFLLSLHDSYMECVQNTHEMTSVKVPKASGCLHGIYLGLGNKNIKKETCHHAPWIFLCELAAASYVGGTLPERDGCVVSKGLHQ